MVKAQRVRMERKKLPRSRELDGLAGKMERFEVRDDQNVKGQVSFWKYLWSKVF